MTTLLFVELFAAILFPAPAAGQAERFEGNWEMDRKRSPDAAGAPDNLKQEIQVNGDQVVIRSDFKQPEDGVYPLLWVGIMVTQDLKLSNNGQQVENQIGPFAHVSRTKIDGKSMVTEWTAAHEGGSVNGKWTRTLSAGGKELTLDIYAKSSDGRVLNKKLLFKRD
ncbi:MAG: hypothetical protein ACRD7E_30910 [Bryobacteraceae bacterium]